MKTSFSLSLLFCVAITPSAQTPERQQFIRIEAPVIALTHVRVIDGIGGDPRDDQTIVISDGKFNRLDQVKTPRHLPMH